VKLLLKRGAKHETDSSMSPVLYARAYGHDAVVKLLEEDNHD
jgi:hypothetical protein